MISFRHTIGFRLLVLSFLMLILPLVVDAIVVFSRSYESRVEEAKRYLSESATLRGLPLYIYEPLSSWAFDIIVDHLNLKEGFPSNPEVKVDQTLEDLSKLLNLHDLALARYDEKEDRFILVGTILKKWSNSDVTDFFSSFDVFDIAKTRADPVVTTLVYQDQLEPYIVSSYAVFSKEGKPIGVISAVTIQERNVLAEDNVYYPVRFALVDSSGIIVQATEPTFLFQYFTPLTNEEKKRFYGLYWLSTKVLPEKALTLLAPVSEDGFVRFLWEGREQFGVLLTIPWWEYSLLAYASKEEIYMLPLMDFIGIVIAYSLILILGCIFIYFLTKRWMRPVRALGAVMLQVKAGELHARYEKDSMGLQINALGAIFNGMVDSLLSSQERAEKESAKRELFAQELQLGREAQKRLLTEPRQDFSPLEIAQLYIPASEVGGDFYDIFRKANGKLIFAIADASGKGVLACCFSLAARNILRTLANIHDDVGMVLWQGNNLFCEDTGESGMFVTVEIAQFDPESRLLSYHSLGHNPAIICRTDGTIEWLKSADMAMGVLVKAEPQRASQIKFEEGDVLVLYTDGVTEAHNPHSQLFGEERLKKVIQRERKEKASVILEQIEKEVKTFAAGRELFDDLTLIVVKYETPL